MKAIILPVKKEFIESIFLGTKRYEFRKKLCKQTIEKILLYQTAPTKMIVGEVLVVDKLVMKPDELWKET